MPLVTLDTLAPGDRFEIPGIDKRGTLVHLGFGTAVVRYDGLTVVEIAGKTFNRPNAPITIAPRTEVVRLRGDTP
jgi:hypothetical protein